MSKSSKFDFPNDEHKLGKIEKLTFFVWLLSGLLAFFIIILIALSFWANILG